jgi:5-methylcytosine-specific restriction endonuclease McrA
MRLTPYKGYEELKPIVLKRDNYTCQWCGYRPDSQKEKTLILDMCRPNATLEEKFRYLVACNLVVHHIDGDKWNNTLENLVTLCQRCHHSYHRKKETIEKTRALLGRRYLAYLEKQRRKM